ncbi:MAG TPA: hypothetical protein VK696_02075 [Steroidobacteraceae bacterium]|jgi:hypothetical protein|nr:hypothetical protein [Steroidobacteraceae bacterium]
MNCELAADGTPVQIGRILETVHAQQSEIHGMLATLDSRARDLDSSLGEAVQRAFMDAAGLRAAERLTQVHRATGLHFARWSLAIVSACALVPAALSWMLMPSRAQLLQARQTADQLSAQVARLSGEGGRIDLQHCGEAKRLCVRVDRKSPFYGANADYMVLKGY